MDSQRPSLLFCGLSETEPKKALWTLIGRRGGILHLDCDHHAPCAPPGLEIKVPGIGSNISVEPNNSTAGPLSPCMHHPKSAAVSQSSESVRLGAQRSRGARRRFVVRPTSAQPDTLRPLRDCSGLWMVHVEMAAAVESFGSTETLDSIPAA